MKVIKKINNNSAICVDENGRELIAFGKGIGFHEIPYELTDLSNIERTFYDIDSRYIGLINMIDYKIIQLSTQIVNVAENHLKSKLNSNLVFTLADHIDFTIERMKKNMLIKIPLKYDIEAMYPMEVKIGRYSIKLIEKYLKIRLPKEEVFTIALHFINAEEVYTEDSVDYDTDKVIEEVTRIIENHHNQKIRRKHFNYSRFVSHMQYLLKRKQTNSKINTENKKLFESIKQEFPNIYECAIKIKDYLMNSISWELSEEELLYLMLHINRLCAREDCNQ